MSRILAEVTVPRHLHVAAFASSRGCMLRAISPLAAEWRLRPSPHAIRGQIFHLLQQKALEQHHDEPVSSSGESLLDEVVAEVNAAISNDAYAAHLAPIEETVPLLEWVNLRRRMVALATTLLLERRRRSASDATNRKNEGTRSLAQLERGRFAEFAITSDALRLSGKIDYLEISDKRVLIVDYKSGRVIDPDTNDVDSVIATQLRLYALLVRERRPHAQIELSVRDGRSEWKVRADDDALDATQALLIAVNRLETGSERSTAALATTGVACVGCSVRARCPAYGGFAPEQWRNRSIRLSLDTWGVVNRVERTASLYAVALHDAAGRDVRIERLSSTHASELKPGDHLCVFNLETIERSGSYPRNFYEMPPDVAHRRAWAATVFVE